MTYKELISKIDNHENFSFSRWGDGEINCILGAEGGQNQLQNCDNHKYYKALGMELYKVIMSKPNYVMGLQGLAKSQRENDPYFKELTSGIDWVASDIIHHASIKNGLDDLFDVLSNRSVILVGNFHLAALSFKYKFNYAHIVIGENDCWLEYEDIKKRLASYIEKNDVVLYCASMMTEVLINDMYQLWGDQITQIDIGSAFDPYVGRETRSYHKKIIEK